MKIEQFEVKKSLLGSYSTHYQCPNCSEWLKSPIAEAGTEDSCPECGTEFIVPGIQQRNDIDSRMELDRQRKKKAPVDPVVTKQAWPSPPPKPKPTTKACDFCAEKILVEAKKCKHCGEFLDGSRQSKNANQIALKTRESGMASLLSLLLPGAGQMYKGQALNGLAWMAVVLVAYLCLWWLGVLFHLCCVIGAGLNSESWLQSEVSVVIVALSAIFAIFYASEIVSLIPQGGDEVLEDISVEQDNRRLAGVWSGPGNSGLHKRWDFSNGKISFDGGVWRDLTLHPNSDPSRFVVYRPFGGRLFSGVYEIQTRADGDLLRVRMNAGDEFPDSLRYTDDDFSINLRFARAEYVD